MDVIAVHLRQYAISRFPYQDNWLIRDLIRNPLISHTIYCLQIVQSLGFISNLKKSDLIPAQKFTFIGMGFLTQQNIVRVPVSSFILTISFSDSSFGTNFSFSFGQTQCSSRLCSPRQTPLTVSANVSIICLETSHSSSRSSSSD